jgi:hypothetical protein
VTGALVTLASMLLVIVALAVPEHRTRAGAAYLLALGALGVVLALRSLFARAARRSAFEAALTSGSARPVRLRALAQIENDCIQGLANPVDLHRRLRPRLQEIAAQRLAARHGIDLDRRPDAARALLGEDAWELVRPDRPPPDEVSGPRVDTATLRRVLDRLEAV